MKFRRVCENGHLEKSRSYTFVRDFSADPKCHCGSKMFMSRWLFWSRNPLAVALVGFIAAVLIAIFG